MAKEHKHTRRSRPVPKRPVTLGGEREKASSRSSSLSSLSSLSPGPSPASSPERSGFGFLRAWSRRTKRCGRRGLGRKAVSTATRPDSEEVLQDDDPPSTQARRGDVEDEGGEGESTPKARTPSSQRTIATQTSGHLHPEETSRRQHKQGGRRHRSGSQGRGYKGRHSQHGGGNKGERSFASSKGHGRDGSFTSRAGTSFEQSFATTTNTTNTTNTTTNTNTTTTSTASDDGLLEDGNFRGPGSGQPRSQGRRGRRGNTYSRQDTSRGNSSMDMSRDSAASSGGRLSPPSSRGHCRGRVGPQGAHKEVTHQLRVQRAPYRSQGRRHNVSLDSGRGSSVGGGSCCGKEDMFARRPETLGGELPASETEPKMNHSWRANRYSKNRNRSSDPSVPSFTLLRRETSTNPSGSPERPELAPESITKLVAEAEKQMIRDPLAKHPSPLSRKRSHGRYVKHRAHEVLNVSAHTVDSHTSSESGRSLWTSMKKLCKSKLGHKSTERTDPHDDNDVHDDDKSSTSSTPRKERRRSMGHVTVTEARPSRRLSRDLASDLRDDWKGEGCRYFFGDFTCLVPELLKDD